MPYEWSARRISSPATNARERKTVFTPEVAFSTCAGHIHACVRLSCLTAYAAAWLLAHQSQIVGVAVAKDSKSLARGLHGSGRNILKEVYRIRFEHILPFALVLRRPQSAVVS